MVKPDRARETRRDATPIFRSRRCVVLLASILIVVPLSNAVSAPGTDTVLVLGASGWTLEYFGREVAILRASLTGQADGVSGNESGSVVLSCSGGQRRLTFSLPSSGVGAGFRAGAGRASGILMIRALPRRLDDPYVTALGQFSRVGTFSIANEAGQSGEPVLSFVRLMLDHPSRLDLLVRDRSMPVTFRSLTPFQVVVSWKASDALPLRNFLTSCMSALPRSP